MGEPYKKHNRKIKRPCPVCGGRVKVAQKNGLWWVYCSCEGFPNHIRQLFFDHADEAVWMWNRQENKLTNYDKVKSMTVWAMASLFELIESGYHKGNECLDMGGDRFDVWLKWLKEEYES